MHDESKQDGSQIDSHAEHLVVLTVAGVERGRRREQVYRTLSNLDRRRVDDAIASLEAVGLVVVNGRSVRRRVLWSGSTPSTSWRSRDGA
jgi:hypothetical protein